MKLADPSTTFEGSLPAGTRLTFQLRSSPKMFAMLSDGIYADKISAVIRELSCNAHDSNVMARSPRPFIVNVPTSLETNFWVEDTGLGIDPAKIVDIFWTYGASTKTDNNDTIGALGLGSKSPFAYTKSSFLVINRYNGVEYKYFCFINEVGIPDGKLVYQAPTTEPNGVRVELAVRIDDVHAFRERIIRFFSFWKEADMPEFHGDTGVINAIKHLKVNRKLAGKTWELRSLHEDLGRGAYAVMGGVPYPINRRALSSPSPALQMVCESMINITFPMGTLDFQVSREELSYTDSTIAALEEGAKNIAQDILAESKAKLAGIKTPHELGKAYRTICSELARSFSYVNTLLSRETFELADGRKFSGDQLTRTIFQVSSKAHLPFNIQRVEGQTRGYTKGTQYYALENVLYVTMARPAVIDPATKKTINPAQQNHISWFKMATTPSPWANQTRKRTAANYLHDGFAAVGTRFEYNGRSSMDAAFIINDLGDRGAEGIRFYTGGFLSLLGAAYSDGHLYFVDGSTSGLNADAVEAGLKEFIVGTQLEGTPIVRLSTLPSFKLPVPKNDSKPRSVAQRGTVEQRMTIHTFENPQLPTDKLRVTTFDIEGFTMKFRVPTSAKTDYVRHALNAPMLYVDTNWGTPVTSLDKTNTEKDTIGALYSLGLLDEFVTPTLTGFEVRIGMLSPNHIEELQRRNVRLVSFKDLMAKAVEMFNEQGDLINAFQQRAKYDSSDDELIMNRFMNRSFHGLKLLSPTNKLVALMQAHDRIKAMLKDDQARNALLFLIYCWELTDQTERLQGQISAADLIKSYPLLKTLSIHALHDDKVAHEHIAAYINTVDSMNEQAKEAARLERLAAAHAEAIFEIC